MAFEQNGSVMLEKPMPKEKHEKTSEQCHKKVSNIITLRHSTLHHIPHIFTSLATTHADFEYIRYTSALIYDYSGI